VVAEVLQYNTPLEVVQLAAGDHQAVQHETFRLTFYDFVKHMVRALTAAKQRGNCYLDEDNQFLQIKTLGLALEADIPESLFTKKTKKDKKALIVCQSFMSTISPHLLSTEGAFRWQVPYCHLHVCCCC
jgi:hypothetical protein